MENNKTFLLSIFLIFILACNAPKEELKDYKEINSIFTTNEISDLNKILDFVDTTLCEIEEENIDNIPQCYNSFFQRLEKEITSGKIDINIPINLQFEFFENISEKTIKEIWMIRQNGKFDTTYFDLIVSGKYKEYLKIHGENSLKVKDYFESFELSSGIDPSMVSDVFNNFDYWDLNDRRERLIIAIHLLTLNVWEETYN